MARMLTSERAEAPTSETPFEARPFEVPAGEVVVCKDLAGDFRMPAPCPTGMVGRHSC